MKTHKLVAIAAATLLTMASLNAVNYNVRVRPVNTVSAQLAHITNFAPVHVYPSTDQLRELSEQSGTDSSATLAAAAPAEDSQAGSAFQLVGSALSMSHYSRVPSIGRISKE